MASETADAVTPRKPATLFTIHILAEYPTRIVAQIELTKSPFTRQTQTGTQTKYELLLNIYSSI